MVEGGASQVVDAAGDRVHVGVREAAGEVAPALVRSANLRRSPARRVQSLGVGLHARGRECSRENVVTRAVRARLLGRGRVPG